MSDPPNKVDEEVRDEVKVRLSDGEKPDEIAEDDDMPSRRTIYNIKDELENEQQQQREMEAEVFRTETAADRDSIIGVLSKANVGIKQSGEPKAKVEKALNAIEFDDAWDDPHYVADTLVEEANMTREWANRVVRKAYDAPDFPYIEQGQEGISDDRKRDSWHTISKDFAEAITDGHFTEPMLRSLGLPEEFVSDVLQVQREAVENVSDTGIGRHRSDDRKPTFVANTYNHEVHSLSQCLQGVSLGGPYAEYALIQVHGGADIRGGYTGPRVYTAWDGWFPHELSYDCRRLDWYNAESCCYRDDRQVFVSDIADVPETLIEEADERGFDLGDDVEEHPAVQNAYDANERGYMDGAGFIFLDGDDDEDGDLGFLTFA